MFSNLTGWHVVIVLAIVLLLFGAAKLPALARSVGQSARIFRSEMKHVSEDDDTSSREAANESASTSESSDKVGKR